MTAQQLPLHIFCGYAHQDKPLFLELKKSLAVLWRQEAIHIWHDGDILPGAHWDNEIEQQLNTADIILLLISPNFIASDYCYNKEMEWALTRGTTGAARVIPILGKPTPNWEKTQIGQLQALPANGPAITSWRNRAEAFADIAKKLSDVIDKMQQEGRYPVKKYMIELQPSVYVKSQEAIPAQEAAKHLAEQWMKDISHIGTLQTLTVNDQEEGSIITNHYQNCQIFTRWGQERTDRNIRPFRSADILLISKHPALLDQLIEAGKLPYRMLHWVLQDDLNIEMLMKQFYEQGGKQHILADQVATTDQQNRRTYHVRYELRSNYSIDPIAITLTSKFPPFPDQATISSARVCLIHDNPPRYGFYRAHKLFSVQMIMSMLLGKLPYKDMWDLIAEACTPS
jgi:TIR domain